MHALGERIQMNGGWRPSAKPYALEKGPEGGEALGGLLHEAGSGEAAVPELPGRDVA